MTRDSARRLRYCVAMSLDGYIAGPNGEADWIVMDPAIDFAAYFAKFDTLLIGRKTWAAMQAMGGEGAGGGSMGGLRSVLLSRTLQSADHPELEIVDDAVPFVTELKAQPGKDIWLFGGGELFHGLLGAGLVDGVDVGVMPVLLGGGIPLLPTPAPRAKLVLRKHDVLEKSGIVGLEYDLVRDA